MIAEARRRVAELRLPINFQVGEAHALPFPDHAFDVCRAARLLEHLPDAGRALTEMVRVTRPSGRIVVFDFDWDTLIIDHPDKETTRTIVLSYSDSIRNGWIGRQLPRLFKEQHLELLSLDPVQVFPHYALQSPHRTPDKRNTHCRSGSAVVGSTCNMQTSAGPLLIGFTALVIVGAKS